jgi:hypothetical protein
MIPVIRATGLFVLLAFLTCSGARAGGGLSALRVVEGTVLEIGILPGEGGLDLVAVRLASSTPGASDLELLLAPSSVLEETGFAIRSGDQLKARIFTDNDGPATVHKVKNLTQGSMVRLRTLRQVPLWDGVGQWQGGPGLGAGGGASGLQGPRHGQHGGSGPPH